MNLLPNVQWWQAGASPLVGVIALAIGGRAAQPANEKGVRFAKFVARMGYFCFVTVSIVLLIWPAPDDWSQRAVLSIHTTFGWWPLDLTVCHLIVQNLTHKFIRWPKPLNPNHPGFPSGHAGYAFGMAWLIASRYPLLAPVWFLVAALIGWARVQTQAHYVYQVVGGAFAGIALGFLVSHRTGGVFLPRCLWP